MFTGANVTLAGFVATEPVYRAVKDKTPKVYMRVAWTTRFRDRQTGEWRDGNTSFATVNCWRTLASNVAPSLRKGQAIVVAGRLQVREFEDKEGKRRTAVDIEADSIGHDMSRGVSHFVRTGPEHGRDAAAAGMAMGEAIRAGLIPGSEASGDGQNLDGQPDEGEGLADAAVTGDDMFDTEAVGALAEAADGAATATAPF